MRKHCRIDLQKSRWEKSDCRSRRLPAHEKISGQQVALLLFRTTHLFPAFSWLVTYWRRPASSIGYFLNTAPHRLARPWLTSGKCFYFIKTSNSWSPETWKLMLKVLSNNTVHFKATYSEATRIWWCRHASSSPSQDWPELQWCNLKTELRRMAQKTKAGGCLHLHTQTVASWLKRRGDSGGYRPKHHSWGMWGISRSPPLEQWGCRTTGSETASERQGDRAAD